MTYTDDVPTVLPYGRLPRQGTPVPGYPLPRGTSYQAPKHICLLRQLAMSVGEEVRRVHYLRCLLPFLVELFFRLSQERLDCNAVTHTHTHRCAYPLNQFKKPSPLQGHTSVT